MRIVAKDLGIGAMSDGHVTISEQGKGVVRILERAEAHEMADALHEVALSAGRPRVVLRSDGTPYNTRVLVDGRPLDVVTLKFEQGVRNSGVLTLTMYVDEVDIAGDAIKIVTVPALDGEPGVLDSDKSDD